MHDVGLPLSLTDAAQVHLQVYDDMPHVLTVFTFTKAVSMRAAVNLRAVTQFAQARYAYRGIAQFARHVTTHPAEYLRENPFPEYHRPECRVHFDGKLFPDDDEHGQRWGLCCTGTCRRRTSNPRNSARRDTTVIEERVVERGQNRSEVADPDSDARKTAYDFTSGDNTVSFVTASSISNAYRCTRRSRGNKEYDRR